MSELITPEGLVKLQNHVYIYHDRSKVEHVLNKYVWERAISFVPMNIAPNTITLIGFIAMAMSYIPMMLYDTTLTRTLPSWLFLAASFLQFFYQTMDGIDGKQARRTKTSSPLGHLFDHGCDSFSLSFFLLTIIQALQLGDDDLTVFLFFAAAMGMKKAVFWVFMWNQCHTHVLLQHIGQIGVVEAQVLIMIVLALTGIFGQSFWMKSTAEFIPSLLTRVLPAHALVETVSKAPIKYTFIYVVIALVATLMIITLVRTTSPSKSRLSILKEHIPFIHLILIFSIWMQTPFYVNHRAVTLLIFGMYFSLITARIIIHGVTEDPFPIYHRELITMTALTPLLFIRVIFPDVRLPFSEEKAFFIFVVLLTLISCYTWIVQIMTEISEHLGIRCFSIDPPEHCGLEPPAERPGFDAKKTD